MCLCPNASAQHDDCVIDQVKVHMFGVAFENDVVRKCELKHGEDKDPEVKLDRRVKRVLILRKFGNELLVLNLSLFSRD